MCAWSRPDSWRRGHFLLTPNVNGMPPETLQLTYEAITNPILRLMLGSAAAVIATLAGVVAYQQHAWRADVRDRLADNQATTKALNDTVNAIEGLQARIDDMRDQFITRLLK